VSEVQSKTMQALARVVPVSPLRPSPATLGISTTAIYAAQRRRAGKPICPCCGQVVRDGFSVKREKK
jgi:hypothetical protein